MSLFKYFTPDRGLEALSECKLMVTPPRYFKDPFEFSPIIKCKDPAAYARRKFDEVSRSPRFFDAHRTDFPGVSNFAQFKKYLNQHKAALLKRFAEGVGETDLRTQNEVLNMLSDSFGVICFAGDGVDPLMWGHYTSSHFGLVVEFRESHFLFSGPSFLRMDYSDERVTYDASDIPDRAGVELFAKRKSSDWAYEKESRLVLRLSDILRSPTPDGVRYFLPIPVDLIVSVTLGLRASDELKKKVTEALRVADFEHVELFQIAQDENKPEFHRRPL